MQWEIMVRTLTFWLWRTRCNHHLHTRRTIVACVAVAGYLYASTKVVSAGGFCRGDGGIFGVSHPRRQFGYRKVVHKGVGRVDGCIG